MLQPTQHVELIVYHLLVTLDVLLQDNLDGDLALRALGLANDAIGACTKGPAKSILGPAVFGRSVSNQSRTARYKLKRGGGVLLLVIAVGLTT